MTSVLYRNPDLYHTRVVIKISAGHYSHCELAAGCELTGNSTVYRKKVFA